MEPSHFHKDLRTLKQRVSELSSKYSPRLRTMAPPQLAPTTTYSFPDPFEGQLQEICTLLHSIEQGIDSYRRTAQRRHGHSAPLPQMCSDPCLQACSPPGSPHVSLEQRIATLERLLQQSQIKADAYDNRLEEMEDRLDSFDPNRFTPASSTAGTLTQETQKLKHSDPRPSIWQSAPVCELYSGADRDPPPTPQQISSSLAPGFGLPPPTTTHRAAASPCEYNPSFDRHVYYSNESELCSCIDILTMHNGALSENIRDLIQEKGILTKQLSEAYKGANRIRPTGRTQEVELPNDSRVHSSRDYYISHGNSGGVDFRDREIARLDEQLTLVNEKLRTSEENTTEKEGLIAQLKSDNAALTTEQDDIKRRLQSEVSRASFGDYELATARKKISTMESQVKSLQMQIIDRDNANSVWESRFQDVTQECNFWHEKAKTLEFERVEHAHTERRGFEQLQRAHKDEMKKMSSFCEEKDIVISKQQENIEWAGSLLKQRDEELENMQKDVFTANRDKLAALQERDRLYGQMAGQIEISKGQLSKMQDEQTATGETPRDNVVSPNDIIEVIAEEPLPASSSCDTLWGDVTASETQRQPIHPYVYDAMSPGFVRQKPALHTPPSPVPRFEKRRRGRSSGHQKRASQRQYPELSKTTGRPPSDSSSMDTQIWSRSRLSQNDKVSKAHESRVAFDLDRLDDQFAPLPMPVTARKYEDSPVRLPWNENWYNAGDVSSGSPRRPARRFASDANLRSSSPNFSRGSHLSKHRSMMELPKHKSFQATVEDEVQSLQDGRR